MNTRDLPVLWFVIPCYNEGGNTGALRKMTPTFLAQLESLIDAKKVSDQSKILFVNDGSKDDTWDIIQELIAKDGRFLGLSLSRNRGHQNALLAGLMEARGHCDITISLDCDGQDDITASERMIDAYQEGSDVVYGVRSSREKDSALKRCTAEAFYKLLSSLGAETVFNHADYRLMSSRSLDGLAEFPETNLFLRGIVPLIGFPSSQVEYKREKRVAGKSHYSLGKMLSLALNGVTSLSVQPVRFASALGIIMSIVGLVGVVWAIVSAILGHAIPGWTSTICVISFIGGMQLLCLGIIGEYVGKIYLEVKHRPKYIIADYAGDWGSGQE